MATELPQSAHAADGLIDQLGEAVVVTDLEWTITDFNASAVALFGHAVEDVLGRGLWMLVPEQLAAHAAAELERVAAGETRRPNGHVRLRDGSTRAVAYTISPLRDAAGTVIGTIAVIRDSSESVLRERQLEFMSRLLGETDTVAVIGTDREGLVTVFNRGAEEMLGYGAEELIGAVNGLVLFDPDELERRSRALGGGSAFQPALDGELDEDSWTLVRKDGSRLEVLLTHRAIFNRFGEVEGFLAFARDISEMRRAEQARLRAEERFRVAFEHAPIGLAITSLDGEDAGRMTQTNPALARMLGREPGELDGVAITEITHPEDLERIEPLFGDVRAGPVSFQKRYLHRDGSVVWAQVNATPVPSPHGGPASHAVTQVLDISERRRFEQRLRHLADHDSLTGLYNRRRFELELERTLERARVRDRCTALLVLDLGGFKVVNDRFGHAVGDNLVCHIAGLLRASVRRRDFLARLGGDEFAIILRDCPAARAATVAEKVIEAIRSRGVIVTPRGTARVTTTVGIAVTGPGCSESAEELAVNADGAMYAAKAEGRNRYAVHSPGVPRPGGVVRDSWFARLRRALDEDRFVLHAQPIVPITSAGMPRYELLVRMRDEDGQLVPPGAFLLQAERFELIGEIDRWVLGRAIALLHRHTRDGRDFSLSVNLSGVTMNDLGLARDLADMLTHAPIPSGRLVVEVTETTAIVNIERARELSVQLREMGCLFALDDFGSGFSSFYYLKHLDFDYLKIDGEFIRNLLSSPTDQLLVRAVVDIARGMGTQTVAEFVGDCPTVQLLSQIGVDYGQGFHLGRPEPAEELLVGQRERSVRPAIERGPADEQPPADEPPRARGLRPAGGPAPPLHA